MRKNSNKSAKINEDVFRTLSLILHDEVKDSRIDPMRVSVISCDVATDLKTAKVYISVLGDEAEQKNVLAGLKSSGGFIRHELARRLNLRNTPELNFILDQSIAYGVKMSKMIDDLVEKEGLDDKVSESSEEESEGEE